MERISSRQNPLVRRFRALANGSAPGGAQHILLDGEHLLREAVASRIPIDVAAFSDPLPELAGDVARHGARVVVVSKPVLQAISPVRTPSGVVAIARRPGTSLERALERRPQLVFLLHDVQDPGNVGAIVRTGEACGATGIVAGEGTADPYGWKALRGSMGSTFRVPIASRVPLLEAAHAARTTGVRVLAAVPRDGYALHETDLRSPFAILLGGEGSGLPGSLLEAADATLSIPMRPPVESLNVGIAAALIAYEASRQRAGAG